MLAKRENKIGYKNFSYKFLFPDSTFHIINFLKKYGTLFSLLESLVTRKISVDSTNADQISFIINLKEVKSKFRHNISLTKAKNVFLDT